MQPALELFFKEFMEFEMKAGILGIINEISNERQLLNEYFRKIANTVIKDEIINVITESITQIETDEASTLKYI